MNVYDTVHISNCFPTSAFKQYLFNKIPTQYHRKPHDTINKHALNSNIYFLLFSIVGTYYTEIYPYLTFC